MSQHNTLNSELLTLDTVVSKSMSFIIPSYQRPYVWQAHDIQKLFNDICNACLNNEQEYFIGTVLSAPKQSAGAEEHPCYELIDGQQRTTTLMLIAIAFSDLGLKHPITDISMFKGQSRLQFTIRDQVQKFLLESSTSAHSRKTQIPDAPYLKHLVIGLQVLRGLIKALPEIQTKDQPTQQNLADYLYSRVCWVNNVVPTGLDLNQLFTTMNTAGVQLEASDILKARLLKRIYSNKAEYEAIWLCCQSMNQYFEDNVKRRFTNSDWQNIQYGDFVTYDPERFCLKPAERNERDSIEQGRTRSDKPEGLSIAELAEEVAVPQFDSGNNQKSKETATLDGEIRCRSIISFPLLQLHTLRIYKARQGISHGKFISESWVPESLLGENSSYSNQDAAKKEIDFQRKPDFDALKLRALFKDASEIKNGLTVCDIRRHRNKMIQLLTEH